MSILIDVNTIPEVFNANCADHNNFLPVKKWILEGKGKLVYGGTKFENELNAMTKYVGIIKLLKDKNKVIVIDKDSVDYYQKKIEEIVNSKDFDDPHVIAIVIASGVKIVCTKDKRSHRFIKEDSLYLGLVDVPSIYSSKAHEHLLSDCNLVKICKPHSKLNRKDLKNINVYEKNM
ncbi:hypothetical protein QE109_02320 [Fusibacter bizertensis]|uniref:PIN domain-containing protein n=1 Tax=Fusibacter bizertensis TaxID=1488331 RepID=A0ABT6N976_9FIRM|nr:hypothetical protein [Fusibacter bizertensis]MDH8676962.1 hypothetical protein [Fusibacter bizertensis]